MPVINSLRAFREVEEACRRCPLYCEAPRVVPGEGPARAALLQVGEQPGYQEELRSTIVGLGDGGHALVTIHLSFPPRIDDAARQREKYRRFVGDLRIAAGALPGRSDAAHWAS